MKVKLWGIKAKREVPQIMIPDSLKESLIWKQRVDKVNSGRMVADDEVVVRIMTGRNVGHWVPATMFSGDCLTNMFCDADGAITCLKDPQNISKLFDIEMIVVEFDI